jgi:hypothetical protein
VIVYNQQVENLIYSFIEQGIMRLKIIIPILIVFCTVVPIKTGLAVEREQGQAFAGQNLHLKGGKLTTHQPGTNRHELVFENGFSMEIGANRFFADSAVVWLTAVSREYLGKTFIHYQTDIYLSGNVKSSKTSGIPAVNLNIDTLKKGNEKVIKFTVTGKIFVTADNRFASELTGIDLYEEARIATGRAKPAKAETQKAFAKEKPTEEPAEKGEPVHKPDQPEEEKIQFRYPVKFAPAGPDPLDIESITSKQGEKAAIVRQRFYLWQKQDEKGGVLELMADNAVIYYSGDENQSSASGMQVKGVYLYGDVVITDGPRTIRAQEGYYDFRKDKGLVINAEMRTYDDDRGMPVYVRAEKIRQVSENKFTADNATITSSEFHKPQICSTMDEITVIDKTPDKNKNGDEGNNIYQVDMRDVRMKYYGHTFFRWPRIKTNLQQSDLPIKTASIGSDSDWGTTLETEWYLSRILGLKEPEGVDTTLNLDYFSKRGAGAGAKIEYEREKYFGEMVGYIIHDSGEDELGRSSDRKDLEPPRKLRGHFRSQHRQYLPEGWQLTTELSYSSDEHFYESFYRKEDLTNKERETVVHLKKIKDNHGLSILGKARLNDFDQTTEEAPTVEYHLTGESFWDDRLTFYSDSTISRFRERYKSRSGEPAGFSDKFHTLFTTRNEVDLPIWYKNMKLVPYAAGTIGYEDDNEFRTNLDGATESGDKEILISELGFRASTAPVWKVYPDVKSELWGIDKLRHVIQPGLSAAVFNSSDSTAEQRNFASFELSQILQTKRGKGEHRRTVDWMRLDAELTFVNNSSDQPMGPDYLIWNRPYSPLYNSYSESVPKTDRRRSGILGPTRNYIGLDYVWNIGDTTSLLSDMNFDLQSGVVQQFNIGLSKLCWPDLRFYIGSRYLKRVSVTADGTTQKGSQDFTFAATYQIDPRYTILFSNSYNFDYGAVVNSEIALIRRYHRVYYGLTYHADQTLDRSAVMFSIWPQGVPEMAIGTREYMSLGAGQGY